MLQRIQRILGRFSMALRGRDGATRHCFWMAFHRASLTCCELSCNTALLTMSHENASAAKVIAIVDDDEAVRRSLARVLRAAGYKAAAYASGVLLLAAIS